MELGRETLSGIWVIKAISRWSEEQTRRTAKTATLTFHVTAPTYSFFGGDNAVLNNGDVEFENRPSAPLCWQETFTRLHMVAARKRSGI